MNKKYFLIVTLVFVATFGALFIVAQYNSNNEVAQKTKPSHKSKRVLDPLLIPFQSEISLVNTLALSDQDAAEKEGEALLKKLPKKYQRYFGLGLKAGMLPIDFYGKVIDQYGVPVVGAKMRYELGGKYLAPGKGVGLLVTDEEGRFEIHSEGGSLVLYGIDHPWTRLFYPPPNRLANDRTTDSPQQESIRILGYQDNSGGGNLLWTDTSPDSPHVFRAWRVDKYEKVESGSITVGIKSDGRVYTYDFLKKDKWGEPLSYPYEGLSDGQLRISCHRDHFENRRDYKDWSVTIEAVNGGIQATDDYYLSLAPEDGYQTSITIKQNISANDYSPIAFAQRFYFTANNGSIYGSLYIDIRSHLKKDLCGIYIKQYKLNANGSREIAIPWKKRTP
jgi:hypothetical protein